MLCLQNYCLVYAKGIFYMNLHADSWIREKSRKIQQAHLHREEKYFQDKQVCWF